MPRLLRGVARTAVVAGTATAVSGRVARRQNARFAQQDAAAYQEQAQMYEPPPAPVGVSTDDKLAQLKELGELKAAGVLTELEFEQQKAAILAQ